MCMLGAIILFFLSASMPTMISMSSVHADHHERTEQNEEKWQNGVQRLPRRRVGEDQEDDQPGDDAVEPEGRSGGLHDIREK